jgi:hypothetical protein
MKQIAISRLIAMGAALAMGIGLNGPDVVQADSYMVDNALSQAPYHNGSHNHALWMPGLENGVGNDFIFTDITGLGTFTENPDGTATLTGMVVSETHSDRGWNLNVTLKDQTTSVLPGSPKKELRTSAPSYIEQGGPVDTTTWHYYGEENGVSTYMGSFIGLLEGKGLYEGATLQLMGYGANFQVGEGANGKNINLGASGWYTWTVLSQPTNTRIMLNNSPNHGDFNIDLKPVPEPGTFFLLGSGLAGLGWWRLRRQSAA